MYRIPRVSTYQVEYTALDSNKVVQEQRTFNEFHAREVGTVLANDGLSVRAAEMLVQGWNNVSTNGVYSVAFLQH
jgi:hypothetical protein